MKKYYIALEQQGCTRRLFIVDAEDEDDAMEKVKEELFNEYESFSVSRKDANEIIKNGGVDLVELEER